MKNMISSAIALGFILSVSPTFAAAIPGQKNKDVMSCLNQWAEKAKGTSLLNYNLATTPATLITGGASSGETELCLNWAAKCLKGKGDIYTLQDPSTPAGWQHLLALDSYTNSELISDIVENTK